MTRLAYRFMFACIAIMPVAATATAAAAQDADTGIYAVARGGVSITPKQKIDLDNLSASFPDDAKYKTGVTGEIGAGYNFGRFRVEQTIGYGANDLNSKDLRSDGFSGDGRTRSLSTTVSGFVDFPVTDKIVPFVGGGVGVARVQTRLTSTDAATGVTNSFDGKDWGLLWHADAGVGYRMSPTTTLEVGARYSQTRGLKYKGVSGVLATSYEPELSNVSGTVGIRHAF